MVHPYDGILFGHKKVSLYAPVRIDLENIMPSEICQIQKDKFCMILLKLTI